MSCGMVHQNKIKSSAAAVQTLPSFPSTSKTQLALMWLYHQMTGYVPTVTTHMIVLLSLDQMKC